MTLPEHTRVETRHFVQLLRSAVSFRVFPFTWRNGLLLLVSVFDVFIYATVFYIVLSAVLSFEGLDRITLMVLGLIVMRWSLGCALQASRLATFCGLCRPFLRHPILSTAIIAMGYPTMVFVFSMGLMIAVLLATGIGESSPTHILLWGAFAVIVQASWNLFLVLIVILARIRRWIVSEVPIFFGFGLILILSPVIYQFRDLPFEVNPIQTSLNPGSHIIAAYHNAMWYGNTPSFGVLPLTVLLALVFSFVVLRARFWPQGSTPATGDVTNEPKRETLVLRSGLWLYDHDSSVNHEVSSLTPWRGELPWMSGREVLQLLLSNRIEEARAVKIYTRLSVRNQADVAVDLPLPVFSDRSRDRLCCAAALAKCGEAVHLDQMLDLMGSDEIRNFNWVVRNQRADASATLLVSARPEIAQLLVRTSN